MAEQPSNNTANATSLGGRGGTYVGPPFLCNIRQNIQDELDNRAKNRVRPITPFIKITPGFSFVPGDKNKVIFDGIIHPINAGAESWKYQMKDLYKIKDGYRPVGGVTNLTVEYKNVTGAVRKAAVSWICHSLHDLERIGPYFLAPGRTMLIEYGWNDYLDLNKNMHLGSFYSYKKDKTFTLATYYDRVQNDVIKSNGNYDALLGIITNYDVTMNPDGGYTCVTHVTSVGDLMGGISMTQQHFTDRNLNPTDSSIPTLREFIENSLDLSLEVFLDEKLGKVEIKDGFNVTGIGTAIPDKPNDRPGSFVSRFADTRKTAIFMSWGYIEDNVINKYLKYKLDENKYVEYDSTLSRIRTHTWLRTTDLNVCMIPAEFRDVYKLKKFTLLPPADEPVVTRRPFGNPRNIMINKDYFKDVFLKAKTVEEAIITLFGKVNDACANLWRFSIRTRDEINRKDREGPITIKEIVDLNYGGGFDLTLIHPYEFKIKSFPVMKNGKQVGTERATGIIRNINVSTKLSNDAALNVFYSSTCNSKNATAIPGSDNIFRSLWNYRKDDKTDPVDDFASMSNYPSNVNENLSATELNERRRVDAEIKKRQEEQAKAEADKQAASLGVTALEYLTYGDQAGWTIDALFYLPVNFMPSDFYAGKGVNLNDYDEWDPPEITEKATTLEKGREIMRSLFSFKGKGSTEDPSTYEAVVPMTCEIELEGISGIRAGDAFTIDNLPELYKMKGVFQVVNITHEISRETWKTKLKSSFRVQRTSSRQEGEVSAAGGIVFSEVQATTN